MKDINLNKRIHVLDHESNVMTVIKDIAMSGLQEEAFYVLDIGDIVRKHQIWKEKLPRVEPYYAVKCNDNLIVIEVLAALGIGFDCASKGEINKVLSVGVDSSRIIFANPAKPASHIRHAAAMRVETMTIDNESELHKIKKLFPMAKIVLRIRCDAEVAQCPLGMKFGCDPINEAPNLLRLARALGLNVIGISFHVGSGCQDPPVYHRAIRHSKILFDIATDLGFKPYLLDIGGGYPGNKDTSIDKMADTINKALDEYFNTDAVHVIAEPGRFYVASAFTLATSIHSKRSVRGDESSSGAITHNMYYINDGVYGSFNCLLYDHQHVTPLPLKDGCGKLIPSSIWGPTCDGLDKVVENILLYDMELGDWILFENMGAYTLPVASPFNGFPVPKVHVVADESIWLLLKDVLPLTEDHFVIGNTPANLRLGLDIAGNDIDPWMDADRQINLAPAEILADAPNTKSSFMFEYVEVDPLN
ncbi:ornithine decarboxylase 1-like [Odontomachus brunneus]|uniref:ornithine decarboxylase 1-like n=1 Tax=Odontomachus brunneus TaxID=486640 RepID=UPI0013F1A1ED|nr:ornithine decarboxylase 1-like [Odontomachus brunneus]XP_032665388.1 ornithine decarboxylase 1-like [Odontomachus brunneus]XP_032665390.1 ornithine decarboxylase 1-like [Odontomachus brunneus]